jgi:surface antigen
MLELAFAYIVSITPAKIITPPEVKRIEIVQGESEYNRAQREEREKREKEELKKRTVRSSPAYSNYAGVEIIGESYEQCVGYAKRVTGINKTLGYAGNTRSEGDTPRVGAIALERSYGHAMAVQEIRPDGIVITESNFIRGKITRRTIPYWDVRGYVY